MTKQFVSTRLGKFRFVDGFVGFGVVWLCWDLFPAVLLAAIMWLSCHWHLPVVKGLGETAGVFDDQGSPKRWAVEYLAQGTLVLWGGILWLMGWGIGAIILWIFAFLDATRNTALSQALFKNPPVNELKEVGTESKSEPKAEPKKEEPKAEPKKEEPKAEPKKEEPEAEPKKEEPKAEPKKEEPKAEADPYVRAAQDAKVVELKAGEGQSVTPKTVIVVLSSGRVSAGRKGVLLELLVTPGQKVKKDDPLFRIG